MMSKWLDYVLLIAISVTISSSALLFKDIVTDKKDEKTEDVKISYLEHDVLAEVKYPFVVDLSKYKFDDVYTDNEMRDMVDVYKLDKEKLTKAEFTFKVKGSKVEITPRDKLKLSNRYEAVFKIRDRKNEPITLRVPLLVGAYAYMLALNEYGFQWEMDPISGRMSSFDIDDYRVIGYESSVGAERFGIHIGDMKSSVTNKYGEAMTSIEKGNKTYKLVLNGEYGMYQIDGYYVTFFYDTFNDNRIRSIYWVHDNVESMKPKFYGAPSDELREGFEDTMVHLVNDTRKKHGLYKLTYDKNLNEIARLHSQDMIDKKYFDHVNKEGLKAMDRMENGGYKGRMLMAGENLAYGQMNSIYAHEGLVNSKGHRENMLREEYTHIGVGVAFTDEGVPYWTILFYETAGETDEATKNIS